MAKPKPRSDPKIILVLLRNLVRVRYRDARLEALRLETIAYCAAEIVRRQRELWGLDE
jgi:hypothetical protein